MAARCHKVLAILCKLLAAASSLPAVSLQANDTCPQPAQAGGLSRDSVLLQAQVLLHAPKAVGGAARTAYAVTSDCASRLRMWERRNAACLVVEGNRALLVRVPYGSAPGWDLPGGVLKGGEAACETAEREVCEETGFQVRALEQLTYNVFRCEVTARNVCTKPVDEGFLPKGFFSIGEIEGLTMRGNTWGDKRALLQKVLPRQPDAAPLPQPDGGGQPDAQDVCGCRVCQNEAFSSRARQCARGGVSEPAEACECLRRSGKADDFDSCGCRACHGEGWSSRAGACAGGSATEPREACECQKRRAAGSLLGS